MAGKAVHHRYYAGAFDQGQNHQYTPTAGVDVAHDLGFHSGPVGQMDVVDLVLDKGGTGPVLRDLGYQPGTKDYKSAQRAIERHIHGTKPTGKWQERYQQLLGPPAGTATITVNGEIKVSNDVRSRSVDIPITGSAQEMLAAMRDPVGSWYVNAGFPAEVTRLTYVTVTYQPQ